MGNLISNRFSVKIYTNHFSHNLFIARFEKKAYIKNKLEKNAFCIGKPVKITIFNKYFPVARYPY